MELNNYYIPNPGYLLKGDENRIIFCNRFLKKSLYKNISEDYIAFIHPLQGLMLSYFDGKRNLKEAIEKISVDFKMPEEKTQGLIRKFLENENEFCLGDGKNEFYFPKNILVRRDSVKHYYIYHAEDFYIEGNELDFSTTRLNKPLDLLLLTNLNCLTNCIYCYADRKRKFTPLSLDEISNIISQARDLKLREFDVNGGEFLLHPEWEKILQKFMENGFMPFISTKLPLSETMIKKLETYGIDTIQVSIDSFYKDELSSLLKVNSRYRDDIINTFKLLDETKMRIHTNSIITVHNKRPERIRKLLDFLTSLRNTKQINLSAAGFSMFINVDEYNRLKPTEEDLLIISEIVDEYKRRFPELEINFASYITQEEINAPKAIKETLFNERSFCTANNTGLIILPDGQVTICEELYWNPNFILGDVKKSSILDIWNSQKALNLYHLNRDMFSPSSYCHICDDLDKCIKKTRCWKMVLMAYGQTHWDYPDPRCPFAPPVKNEIYHV